MLRKQVLDFHRRRMFYEPALDEVAAMYLQQILLRQVLDEVVDTYLQ
jgi:hypothetical protein